MVGMGVGGQQTPLVPSFAPTPAHGAGGSNLAGLQTPAYGTGAGMPVNAAGMPNLTPELYQQMKIDREIAYRNRPLSDAELDAMLPGSSQGYRVVNPPAGYDPVRTPARKAVAGGVEAMTPMHGLYAMPSSTGDMSKEQAASMYGVSIETGEGLPDMKVEDQQYFGKLLKNVDESSLSVEELKERKILKLLLKVKNGTAQQRKSGLKHLADKAKEFGPGPLFNQILPLLMSPTLEDQERHLLVKVVDRILIKLGAAAAVNLMKGARRVPARDFRIGGAGATAPPATAG